MKTKKIISIILAILAILPLLAACTETKNDSEPQKVDDNKQSGYLEALPETDKLVLYRTTSNYYLLDPAVKIFRQLYPDVDVEVIDFMDRSQEYDTLIQTEISSGKGPDLLLTMDASEFPDIYKVMDTEVFCDLNDFLGGDPDFDLGDYNKVVMDSGIYKGKRYIAPINYYRDILMTTEETLSAAGIDPGNIRSFDGLTGEIKKYLEKYASTKLVYNQQFQYFHMLFPWSGVDYIDYETKTLNIGGEDFKKAMEAYKDIYAQDGEPGEFNGLYAYFVIADAIRSGQVAFGRGFLLNAALKFFANNYGALAADGYTPVYFPFPSINGEKVAKVIDMAAILIASQNKLNAYRFVKILLSGEIQGINDTDGLLYSYFPVLNAAIETKINNQLDYEIVILYEGKVVSTPEEILRDYMAMVADIDSCHLLVPGPLASLFANYMVPYFAGTDTYENCLGNSRNYLELYLSE